uniref:Uncharacterized protein n=1 Tax=Anopheles stephensi TaxID=30069 RepID=A0A182YHS9_ANOST
MFAADRVFAFIFTLSLCLSYALATECPHCIGVAACGANQTIPKVTCTPEVVNQTVIQLSTFYKNASDFMGNSTQYGCVKVNFIQSGFKEYTFSVQGCTSGSKSVCSQPTVSFNGELSCSYYSGSHRLYASALLSVALIVGALVMSS